MSVALPLLTCKLSKGHLSRTCVRIYWTFKTLGGAGCLIDNDNNYTNDVNSGLLNSLSMLDLLLYGKVTSSSHQFSWSLLLLSYKMPNLPMLYFTGHWRKLHPIVSLDTIPASRSSKRLRELVSICMLRVKQWMILCVLWALIFGVCLIVECRNWLSFS